MKVMDGGSASRAGSASASTSAPAVLAGAAARRRPGNRRPGRPALTALGAVALAAAAASLAAMPGFGGILGAMLAAVMLAIAVIDARSFIIPDELSAAGGALGLVFTALTAAQDPEAGLLPELAAALARGLILAGAFYGLRALHLRLRGREGMGLGDVKLAAVAGIWLSLTTLPIAVEIAALSALTVVLARRLAGARIRASSRLPFGLFLAPAIWLGWLLEATLLAP
jgi:leader peptidase (prepilin peptidase)/N-methyltransferase